MIKGLDAVFRFMQSVGRYGNSPFLWTMFGSGDLAQCFSRKCAVFGGTYCLKRKVEGFVISNEKLIANHYFCSLIYEEKQKTLFKLFL